MLARLGAAAASLTTPLDERGAWYRYHPLFAELLRAELRAQAPGRGRGAAPARRDVARRTRRRRRGAAPRGRGRRWDLAARARRRRAGSPADQRRRAAAAPRADAAPSRRVVALGPELALAFGGALLDARRRRGRADELLARRGGRGPVPPERAEAASRSADRHGLYLARLRGDLEARSGRPRAGSSELCREPRRGGRRARARAREPRHRRAVGRRPRRRDARHSRRPRGAALDGGNDWIAARRPRAPRGRGRSPARLNERARRRADEAVELAGGAAGAPARRPRGYLARAGGRRHLNAASATRPRRRSCARATEACTTRASGRCARSHALSSGAAAQRARRAARPRSASCAARASAATRPAAARSACAGWRRSRRSCCLAARRGRARRARLLGELAAAEQAPDAGGRPGAARPAAGRPGRRRATCATYLDDERPAGPPLRRWSRRGCSRRSRATRPRRARARCAALERALDLAEPRGGLEPRSSRHGAPVRAAAAPPHRARAPRTGRSSASCSPTLERRSERATRASRALARSSRSASASWRCCATCRR